MNKLQQEVYEEAFAFYRELGEQFGKRSKREHLKVKEMLTKLNQHNYVNYKILKCVKCKENNFVRDGVYTALKCSKCSYSDDYNAMVMLMTIAFFYNKNLTYQEKRRVERKLLEIENGMVIIKDAA